MFRIDVSGLGEWFIIELCVNCCKGEVFVKFFKWIVIIVYICLIYK